VAVGVASPTSNADITVDITTRTNLLAISRLSGSSRKRRNLFWRINGVHICHDGSEGVVVCLFICLQGFHCLCLLRPVRLYELFGHISLMSFVELVIRDVISGAPPPTPPSPPGASEFMSSATISNSFGRLSGGANCYADTRVRTSSNRIRFEAFIQRTLPTWSPLTRTPTGQKDVSKPRF
jgi:hypothetical protein